MRALAKIRASHELGRAEARLAARFALEEFAQRHPGRSVEIRVPFAGAIQVIEGPTHRRGTPPNVVEMDIATWLAIVVGKESWLQAREAGAIDASGTRADLAAYLPLFGGSTLARWEA